ncbi:MAG: two component transcriptional regulator, LuxR family [uncultured bacterium]|nr:MAG: two component transcriptional regulator, LuxR family [uncultured bacterium]HBH18745.1 DNA-binding response regulator [Cyanobacteria bacterium UBA9579]
MNKLCELGILIIEDHTLTRFGLKTALESMDQVKLILEAEDGETGIELAKEHNPDVVLMDLGLPGINGIEATKSIKKFDNKIKIIVLTSHNNEDEVWAALGAGANAYCLKDIEPDRLIHVIESVYDGAAWFDPAIAETILKTLSNGKSAKVMDESCPEESEEKIQLTDREMDVLRLIVDGYSNAEISEKLCVSIHTAKAHVCNILQKLSVDDRTQAAIKALKDGIV